MLKEPKSLDSSVSKGGGIVTFLQEMERRGKITIVSRCRKPLILMFKKELLAKIFAFCDFYCLQSLSLASRKMRAIVNDSDCWKEKCRDDFNSVILPNLCSGWKDYYRVLMIMEKRTTFLKKRLEEKNNQIQHRNSVIQEQTRFVKMYQKKLKDVNDELQKFKDGTIQKELTKERDALISEREIVEQKMKAFVKERKLSIIMGSFSVILLILHSIVMYNYFFQSV